MAINHLVKKNTSLTVIEKCTSRNPNSVLPSAVSNIR